MPALPADYDSDPERFRAARLATERYAVEGDVHDPVAARLVAEHLAPVLDVGGGDGALIATLPPGWPTVGVDTSPALLASYPSPAVRADATRLPVATGSMAAVAALWMLYHLDDPATAVAEAHRVLRPGGLFAACTTARDDSPELVTHLSAPAPTSFDAEEAESIVGTVFPETEALHWDAPLVELPDRAAATDYLRGRGIDGPTAAEVAGQLDLPMAVTKRGVLVWGRKPGEA